MVQSIESKKRLIMDELNQGFPVQNKYMIESTPDRISLQNMEKKVTKTFREYAHKWRDLAA